MPTSTELQGFYYYQGKYNNAQETLSRNPNPNYTLALSHIKNKNRSWLPLSSLFSLMQLLTRLIGIFLLFHSTRLQLKYNIYIYIYIKVKVGCLGIAIPSCIRSIVIDLSGRGLVAIQATRPTSTTSTKDLE